jgi:hypothetical protein
MAEYTPGRSVASVAGGREQRLAAMLAKWPVLSEEWAQELERRRMRAADDVGASRTGIRTDPVQPGRQGGAA